MKIAILNGPNLNLLGKREPALYGHQSFEDFFRALESRYPSITFSYFQSNVEGELINKIQEVGYRVDGIILNAGGYTHTSVSLADTISAIESPVVEVHISNIYAREAYRHESLTAKKCIGIIAGFGFKSYTLAINYLLSEKVSD